MIEVDTYAAEEHEVENLVHRLLVIFFLKLQIDQVLKLFRIKGSIDVLFFAVLKFILISHIIILWT